MSHVKKITLTELILIGGLCLPAFASIAGVAPDADPAAATSMEAEAGKAELEVTRNEYEALIASDLARQIPADELLYLGEGEQRFLSLHEKSLLPQVHGAALLLHDLGANVNDANIIRPLRKSLPEFGWETLSIQLPIVKLDDQKQIYLELIAPIKTRITQGLAHLNLSSPQRVIIIAHGLGAAAAVSYLDDNNDANLQAAVLISLPAENALQPNPPPETPPAATPAPDQNEDDPDQDPATATTPTETKPDAAAPTEPEGKNLNTLISERKLPLLDIYGEMDYRDVIRSAEIRQQLMQRQQGKPYQQQVVLGADHDFHGQQTQLTRRIRGWLNKTFGLPLRQ